MELDAIRNFFDERAESWPSNAKNNYPICKIIELSEIKEGDTVLDVASGRGIMVPFYLDKNVASLVCVDLSPLMCDLARAEYESDKVKIVCADVLEYTGGPFDKIMVFNALPHFENDKVLIAKLASLLKRGGRLTIAHDRSRARINSHHKGVEEISKGLIPAAELACEMNNYFMPDIIIDSDEFYMVSGIVS